MNDRIMHQDNKIEVLGKVFKEFRDVLEIAILCGMTLCEGVCAKMYWMLTGLVYL